MWIWDYQKCGRHKKSQIGNREINYFAPKISDLSSAFAMLCVAVAETSPYISPRSRQRHLCSMRKRRDSAHFEWSFWLQNLRQ